MLGGMVDTKDLNISSSLFSLSPEVQNPSTHLANLRIITILFVEDINTKNSKVAQLIFYG